MDDNSDPEKDATTSHVDRSNCSINSNKGASEDSEEGNLKMSRRGMLLATGTVTASLVGRASGNRTSRDVEVQPLNVYGYGGREVLSKSSEVATVEETEPNDQRSTAMEVSLGTKVNATLETASVDWFAFDAQSGVTVVAEFSRSSTDGVTSVILYGPDGDYIDLVFVGTDQPVSVVETIGTSGTHYVEVVDIQRSKGKYSLALTTGSGTDTGTETGSETPTATETEDDYGEQAYGGQTYGGIQA